MDMFSRTRMSTHMPFLFSNSNASANDSNNSNDDIDKKQSGVYYISDDSSSCSSSSDESDSQFMSEVNVPEIGTKTSFVALPLHDYHRVDMNIAARTEAETEAQAQTQAPGGGIDLDPSALFVPTFENQIQHPHTRNVQLTHMIEVGANSEMEEISQLSLDFDISDDGRTIGDSDTFSSSASASVELNPHDRSSYVKMTTAAASKWKKVGNQQYRHRHKQKDLVAAKAQSQMKHFGNGKDTIDNFGSGFGFTSQPQPVHTLKRTRAMNPRAAVERDASIRSMDNNVGGNSNGLGDELFQQTLFATTDTVRTNRVFEALSKNHEKKKSNNRTRSNSIGHVHSSKEANMNMSTDTSKMGNSKPNEMITDDRNVKTNTNTNTNIDTDSMGHRRSELKVLPPPPPPPPQLMKKKFSGSQYQISPSPARYKKQPSANESEKSNQNTKLLDLFETAERQQQENSKTATTTTATTKTAGFQNMDMSKQQFSSADDDDDKRPGSRSMQKNMNSTFPSFMEPSETVTPHPHDIFPRASKKKLRNNINNKTSSSSSVNSTSNSNSCSSSLSSSSSPAKSQQQSSCSLGSPCSSIAKSFFGTPISMSMASGGSLCSPMRGVDTNTTIISTSCTSMKKSTSKSRSRSYSPLPVSTFSYDMSASSGYTSSEMIGSTSTVSNRRGLFLDRINEMKHPQKVVDSSNEYEYPRHGDNYNRNHRNFVTEKQDTSTSTRTVEAHTSKCESDNEFSRVIHSPPKAARRKNAIIEKRRKQWLNKMWSPENGEWDCVDEGDIPMKTASTSTWKKTRQHQHMSVNTTAPLTDEEEEDSLDCIMKGGIGVDMDDEDSFERIMKGAGSERDLVSSILLSEMDDSSSHIECLLSTVDESTTRTNEGASSIQSSKGQRALSELPHSSPPRSEPNLNGNYHVKENNAVTTIQAAYRGHICRHEILKELGIAKRRKNERKLKSQVVTKIQSNIRRAARQRLRSRHESNNTEVYLASMAVSIRHICAMIIQDWWVERLERMKVSRAIGFDASAIPESWGETSTSKLSSDFHFFPDDLRGEFLANPENDGSKFRQSASPRSSAWNGHFDTEYYKNSRVHEYNDDVDVNLDIVDESFEASISLLTKIQNGITGRFVKIFNKKKTTSESHKEKKKRKPLKKIFGRGKKKANDPVIDELDLEMIGDPAMNANLPDPLSLYQPLDDDDEDDDSLKVLTDEIHGIETNGINTNGSKSPNSIHHSTSTGCKDEDFSHFSADSSIFADFKVDPNAVISKMMDGISNMPQKHGWDVNKDIRIEPSSTFESIPFDEV